MGFKVTPRTDNVLRHRALLPDPSMGHMGTILLPQKTVKSSFAQSKSRPQAVGFCSSTMRGDVRTILEENEVAILRA